MYATYEERKKDGYVAIPVKELQYNRAPAVAPLGVLTQNDGWDRLKLDPEVIEKHSKLLLGAPHLAENIRSLYESRPEFTKSKDAEEQLYDSFVSDRDRLRIETVRNATERELADFHPEFTDDRLPDLLVRYKARSFPGTLNEGEMAQWEQWRAARLQSQLPGYISALQRLSTTVTDDNKQFLLQELQLWAESIIEPAE